VIFILLGLTATGLGSTLKDHRDLLTKISAALIIAMGILFVSSLFITRLNREWHVDALMERAGKGGPIVAGAAFAIAWTPCIGPTLAAILAAASLSGSAGKGAFLLAVYSVGLAIPFLLTAVAFSRMTSAFAVIKRHYQLIVATGGVILIAMGVLIWTGQLTQLNSEAQRWLSELGLEFLNGV
jgi:cytochrome c-type biogenesis protein